MYSDYTSCYGLSQKSTLIYPCTINRKNCFVTVEIDRKVDLRIFSFLLIILNNVHFSFLRPIFFNFSPLQNKNSTSSSTMLFSKAVLDIALFIRATSCKEYCSFENFRSPGAFMTVVFRILFCPLKNSHFRIYSAPGSKGSTYFCNVTGVK
ncbi:hypothetical protein AKO1_007702 [Acrasis kona]|uniref:Uncharacterized protein n=1 Tax=Acrasis kona TaxID=1008807 RepID=A0AAW2YQY1_9EUKA